ncbi:MAG: LysR family transcriptional regulator, partial [Burkholderiales bacterium]|nr:LysR family transcriptional regulator [Burkholderiales bacterium]
ALRESGAGVFRIASTPALGQSVLPAAMEHFARKFPQVRLNVQTLSRREIEERLRVGLYDIALTNMPYDRAEFNVSVVHESEAVCISAPKHRFAKLRVVQLSDLVGEGLISLSNEDPVTQALREQFVKHEMSMSTSIETIYSSTMCTFAAHGLGVGIINPYMAAVFKDRLCIRAFRPRLPVTTYVAFTRFSPASELAQHFHSSIKAAYRSGW